MENPFAKLVSENFENKNESEAPQRRDNVIDFSKAKDLLELKGWRTYIQIQIAKGSHPGDRRKLEQIDSVISKLEDELKK